MTPEETESLKKEASNKINEILSQLSMRLNSPIKSVRLNNFCSYYKDSADASYYLELDFDG